MIAILIILLMPPAVAAATPPDTITLEEARERARQHNPVGKQGELYHQITDITLQNLDTGWYPDLSLRGTAQYQSDVTEVDIEPPVPDTEFDFPSQPYYRYEIGLHLDQRIYDGGVTRSRRESEQRSRDVRLQEIEVNQHHLQEQVESVYFAILSLRTQQSSLEMLKEDLETRIAELETARREGTVPASAVDLLSAELIEIRQNRLKLESRERSAVNALSELISTPLDEQVALVLPEYDIEEHELNFNNRPEMHLFQAQRDQLESRRGLAASALLPAVSAFGQASYGRPGLNLFDDEFQPWFIIGIRAQWSFWDWGNQSREQEALTLQQHIVDRQQDEFLMSLRAEAHEELVEIRRLQNAMELDDELIALRDRIVNEAESRLDHGAITATEYLGKLNARHRAKLLRHQHEIELARAYVKLNTRMGDRVTGY